MRAFLKIRSLCPRGRRGFTFVEIVIVLLILGILSTVAAPKLFDTSDTADLNAFAAQLSNFADAFDLYKADHGVYPNNASTRVLPTGMDQYIDAADFAKPTPLGGYWDYAATGAGTNAGVGVEYLNGVGYPGNAVFLQLDAMIDDGNLSTGSLTLLNSTTKWIYWRYGN